MNNTVVFLVCLLFLSGCSSSIETISDLETLPQNTAKYLDSKTQNTFLSDPLTQQKKTFVYETHYFKPWQGEKILSQKQAFWGLQYTRKTMYGDNLQKIEPEFINHLVANMDLDSYPKREQKAIITANTALRTLPTHKPFFYNFSRPGEGYPFDYLQNSAIYINTPVLITHESRDKAWVYVQAPFAAGWIPSVEVAYVDEKLIGTFMEFPLGVAVEDEFSLFDQEGRFVTQMPLGAIVPLADNNKGLVAVRNTDGHAELQEVQIDSQQVRLMPLPLTRVHLSQMANKLLGEHYGWGGMYLNRDCSAFTRDLFAPFGIWLPRNSAAQKNAGNYITLKHLNPEEKKRLIMEKGIPFGTLLYMKGHIMLYLGIRDNEPVAMHNVWGIRTKDWMGKEGRHIIGKAVITTLEPGKELSDFDRDGNLLKRILGMTNLF